MDTRIYPLDTPVNRKLYIPGEEDTGFAPVISPPPASHQDQSHRQMTWLFHKPQAHAIFPIPTESVKIAKKK